GATGATGAGHTLVLKTGTDSVSGDNTVNNDDQLFLAMGANEIWEFEAFIIASVGASNDPDFKFTFAVPTGATINWVATRQKDSDANSGGLVPVTASGTERNVNMDNNDVFFVRVRGIVQNGSNAGNLQFQWAQNNANATATSVQINSFLKAGKF
ncbi:MAG TPA: hypothetical protein VFT55_00475, partial [Planctomycetota bacterium]|nr:hypothetical protein [Planctomycetota bacterium]